MKTIDAKTLAEANGHIGHDSVTTLKTIINHGADILGDEVEEMDLRVCGTGSDAFLEWITQDGDPIGDMFYEIDRYELESNSPIN